jgi:hypothetical protein
MKSFKDRYFAIMPILAAGCFAASLTLAGCNSLQSSISALEHKPRLRKGAYFGSVLPPVYLGPGELGIHNVSEKNGYVYCCNGGFIDTDHLRKSVDWTKYLADKTYERIMKGDREFRLKLREPSRYHIKLDYPEYWRSMCREGKEEAAREVSIHIGQYVAHTACAWHEMLTWFGYTWTEIGSEYMSAFSWDDIYSNLLGSRIGAAAMRDKEHGFNEAVTLAIDRELERLGAQPPEVAREAAKEIKGQWYTGGYYFFVDTKKRHFDVGLDGYISPWLVPTACEGASAISYRIPDTQFVDKYGFSIKVEIEPRERIKGKILRIVYPDGKGRRIKPDEDFGPIMSYIKEQAVARYGFDVSLP